MPQKEKLTKKEMETDIRSNLKAPRELTEAEWKKLSAIALVLLLSIAVLFFVNYRIAIGALFALFPIGIALMVGEYLLRRRQSRTARIEDYEIVKKPLSHIRLEKYERQESNGRRSGTKTITIRYLCFEGYPEYRIPEENYRWSREYVLSDFFIYENAHRGDDFVLAIHKKTNTIAAAYSTAFFDYKE